MGLVPQRDARSGARCPSLSVGHRGYSSDSCTEHRAQAGNTQTCSHCAHLPLLPHLKQGKLGGDSLVSIPVGLLLFASTDIETGTCLGLDWGERHLNCSEKVDGTFSTRLSCLDEG